MEVERASNTFQTTADRLGLVFRTKTELYYFLACECIVSLLFEDAFVMGRLLMSSL